MRYGIVILAAGSSRRMGRPKLLLPWGETTIIGWQISTWRDLQAAQIAVVHRPDDSKLLLELERVRMSSDERICNPCLDDEMFASVRCAANWSRWNPNLTHFVISLGDQPHIKRETLSELLRFSAAHPEEIGQPLYDGRARHPIVLPRRMFLRLADTGVSTLKEFLSKQSVITIPVNDPGLGLDIDEPADYERALRLVRQIPRIHVPHFSPGFHPGLV